MAVAAPGFPAAAAANAPLVPALTGVRALAAAWVVAYHLWLTAARPRLAFAGIDATPFVSVGWLGVEVFFVLSGFVLAWQVCGSQARGQAPFAPARFWPDAGQFIARRAVRVYPAYLACLSVLLALAAAQWHGTWPPLADIALHLALFHNLVPQYVDSINGVFWSMPFEWQFYLLFPALVLPLLRGRVAAFVLAAIAIAGGAKLVSLLLGPGAEIAQLPWRADLFAAGMLAAFVAVKHPPSPRWRHALAMAGGASLLVGAQYFGWREFAWWTRDAVPFGHALWMDASAAMLLVGVCGPVTGIARLLSLRAIVWLGTISYSVYLWHLPVLAITRRLLGSQLHGGALLATMLVAIVAVSAASYYCIERPFHAPAQPWALRRRVLVVLAWAAAVLAASAAATLVLAR